MAAALVELGPIVDTRARPVSSASPSPEGRRLLSIVPQLAPEQTPNPTSYEMPISRDEATSSFKGSESMFKRYNTLFREGGIYTQIEKGSGTMTIVERSGQRWNVDLLGTKNGFPNNEVNVTRVSPKGVTEYVNVVAPGERSTAQPTITYKNSHVTSPRTETAALQQSRAIIDEFVGLTDRSSGGPVVRVKDSRPDVVYHDRTGGTLRIIPAIMEKDGTDAARKLLGELPVDNLTPSQRTQRDLATVTIRERELREGLPDEVIGRVDAWDTQIMPFDRWKKGPVDLGAEAMELWELRDQRIILKRTELELRRAGIERELVNQNPKRVPSLIDIRRMHQQIEQINQHLKKSPRTHAERLERVEIFHK